jgi:hypothetical protein
MSAILPAPTACTLAAAPPDRTRKTINMEMLVLIAERIAKRTKRINEAMYIVLLPNLSEKEDHHNGKMDMLSMYTATDMLATVSVAWKATLISCSTGITIAEPIGAAMAQKATMKVKNHFVRRV